MISLTEYNFGMGTPGERRAYAECIGQYDTLACNIPFYGWLSTNCQNRIAQIESCARLRLASASALESADWNARFPDTPVQPPNPAALDYSAPTPNWVWAAAGLGAFLLLRGITK